MAIDIKVNIVFSSLKKKLIKAKGGMNPNPTWLVSL